MLNEPIQFLVLLDQLKRFEWFKMMAETARGPAFVFQNAYFLKHFYYHWAIIEDSRCTALTPPIRI